VSCLSMRLWASAFLSIDRLPSDRPPTRPQSLARRAGGHVARVNPKRGVERRAVSVTNDLEGIHIATTWNHPPYVGDFWFACFTLHCGVTHPDLCAPANVDRGRRGGFGVAVLRRYRTCRRVS
jgi:hypothetical protein